MDEQNVMLSVLTKYFGKTEDEVKALMYEEGEDGNLVLKEGVSDTLINMDAERIKRIREEERKAIKPKFDDFAKKTKREVMTQIEKEVKEKYGLDTDKTGIELIEELTQHVSKGGDITEDTLKTHPLFIKLEKNIHNEWEEKLKGVQGEFETFKESVERNKKIGDIKSKAKAEFLALKPVLSDDPAKAERQTQTFLSLLERYDYIVDGDTIIVKNGEGRLEDSHGNPVAFDSFVKAKAEELYDFAVQDAKGSPGNKTPVGVGGKRKITKDEYGKMVAYAERTKDYSALKDFDNNYIVV